MKIAMTTLMKTQGIVNQLEQIENAGFELLDRMVVALGRGVNPSPMESRPRPQTAK